MEKQIITRVSKPVNSNILKVCLLFLGMICLSNSSCDKNAIDGIRTAEFNHTFELALNDQVILPKEQKEIMLELTALNDSRCPANVQCVWAGNAAIEVIFTDDAGSKSSAALCICQCDSKLKNIDSAYITLNNNKYSIELSAISRSTKPSAKAKASIQIKKL